jgi:putative flippase GtrA
MLESGMEKLTWAERIWPYAMVAAVVTAADYAIFITLIKTVGLAPVIANVCSWAVAVVVAYGLHSAFTFKMPISLKGFIGYVVVCLSTLILGTAVLAISMIYITPIAAKVASTILVFTASFALSHLTVFRTV